MVWVRMEKKNEKFSLVVKIGEIICLHKVKEEREENMTQRIYVVRQYAYIHRRR